MSASRAEVFIETKGEALTPSQQSKLTTALSEGPEGVDVKWGGHSGFDAKRVLAELETEKLGHVLLHAKELPSTQNLLTAHQSSLSDGSVCLALCQTSGRGRRDNKWVSPEGCLMFSIYSCLTIPPDRSPFLNYVVCLAVVRGIKHLSAKAFEGQEVDVKIKWPNDIYYKDKKIGGILLNSSVRGSNLHLVTGIGLNVLNEQPTACLKHIFEEATQNRPPPMLTLEDVLAEILNHLEPLMETFLNEGFEKNMKDAYLANWMHSGTRLKTGDSTEVTIIGISDSGYLLAISDQGESMELFPDGNTIDMLQGLIIKRVQS